MKCKSKICQDLPVFTVRAIDPDGRSLRGAVSRWLWVGERYWAFLYLGDGHLMHGRFKDVHEQKRQVTFVLEDPKTGAGITPGMSFPYFDGYWGERAELVLDQSIHWEAIDFVPRDSVRIHPDGRRETIPGGWDHEHCDICWATIDTIKNQRHMLSKRKHHICCTCFKDYIQAHSIDFINDGT